MRLAEKSIRSKKDGAGDGTRTRDNLLGKQELYQLSYTRKSKAILAPKTTIVKSAWPPSKTFLGRYIRWQANNSDLLVGRLEKRKTGSLANNARLPVFVDGVRPLTEVLL